MVPGTQPKVSCTTVSLISTYSTCSRGSGRSCYGDGRLQRNYRVMLMMLNSGRGGQSSVSTPNKRSLAVATYNPQGATPPLSCTGASGFGDWSAVLCASALIVISYQ